MGFSEYIDNCNIFSFFQKLESFFKGVDAESLPEKPVALIFLALSNTEVRLPLGLMIQVDACSFEVPRFVDAGFAVSHGLFFPALFITFLLEFLLCDSNNAFWMCSKLSHHFYHVHHPTTIAPFIVVPCNYFENSSIYHGSKLRIKNRRVRIMNNVRRDQL